VSNTPSSTNTQTCMAETLASLSDSPLSMVEVRG
jgi:hypothetical protein